MMLILGPIIEKKMVVKPKIRFFDFIPGHFEDVIFEDLNFLGFTDTVPRTTFLTDLIFNILTTCGPKMRSNKLTANKPSFVALTAPKITLERLSSFTEVTGS